MEKGTLGYKNFMKDDKHCCSKLSKYVQCCLSSRFVAHNTHAYAHILYAGGSIGRQTHAVFAAFRCLSIWKYAETGCLVYRGVLSQKTPCIMLCSECTAKHWNFNRSAVKAARWQVASCFLTSCHFPSMCSMLSFDDVYNLCCQIEYL